jgi:hypothetical protein
MASRPVHGDGKCFPSSQPARFRSIRPSLLRFRKPAKDTASLENIMPRYILLDELHLMVSVPHDMPEGAIGTIRRHLNSRNFEAAFRQAIRSVFQHHPQLRKARVRVTR